MVDHILSTAFYVLGYITGCAAFAWLAKRRKMSTEGIYILLFAGLIGGLAGANLVQFLATGIPGKTVLGGLACGYLSVILAKQIMGIKRPTGDLFALGISAGEAVGRWGCFFGGCCGGKNAPHWLPLTVFQDDAWKYPSQAYDSIANAAIFLLLLRLLKKNLPENTLFYTQGTLYCVARFAIEYTRTGSTLWLGLTLAQLACVAGAVYFGVKLRQLLTVRVENRQLSPNLSYGHE